MDKIFLDTMAAAKSLKSLVLNEADKVNPDCRMSMQAEFHLRNGVFNRS